MFAPLLFGAKTGTRVSEIIGVRWQDLDLHKSHVTFRQGISRGRVGPLKRGHGRIVDLSPELASVLRGLKVERQRECLAAGLLQSTNLSFIVVAVAVGTELGRMREMNGSALILAGLASAVLLPTAASALLGGATQKARGGAAAA